MPTPVTTARQCLTTEAAQALDDAVTVARRRGHAQTTSLHAVSALLSLPSSALREACGRARNSAYSCKIQFKALELSLGVSLDRLPSSPQRVDEPPVSNSLMAAIKRSQANQRRQPENFQLYHQQQQQQQQSSTSAISMVKVELQNLILSILDDPVVSRVFAEAGFRSCDIKLAILRPVHQLLRYSRYKGPPMFLCNLTDDSDLGRRGFSFPFLGSSGFFGGDENCRRIGEILVRKKGRNPLLVGVCSNDALHRFLEIIERKRGVLPIEISGLNSICVENDISKFVTENSEEWVVKLRFEEVGRMVEHCVGAGVIVTYGDLNALIGDNASVSTVSCVVGELTRLLDVHGEKVWLIGAAASYETYLKFSNVFPSIEKAWDLQLLPITSLRPSMGESYPRSSLMESFVPFGGLFSAPSDLKSPLSSSNQSSLPSWLQMAELGASRGLDTKAEDNGLGLSAKAAGLRKKWDNSYQLLHHTQRIPKADTYQVGFQVPTVTNFHVVDDKKENADNHNNNNRNASSNASEQKNVNSCLSADLQKNSSSKPSLQLPEVSKTTDENFTFKLCKKNSITENLELGDLSCSPLSLSNSSVGYDHASPTSATSVTTDLGLGICSTSISRELNKPTNQSRIDFLQNLSGCCSVGVDLVTPSTLNNPAQSSGFSCPDLNWQLDQSDFKTLHRALSELISGQEEAASVICQTVARCRTRNEKHYGASLRGDIWFSFLGPDDFGKKRAAIALAETLYGSSNNFFCVDLSSQDGTIHTNTIYDCREMNGYDVKFRGKTVVDYISGELSRKPWSVVFLENIDKADLQAQNSLSQAMRTGRISDSHGREVSINNAVFVTTSRFTKGNKILSFAKETSTYSEERILKTKGWPIRILVGRALGEITISHDSSVLNSTRKGISNPIFLNKRKLIGTSETAEEHETSETAKRGHKMSNSYLDLNIPAEEIELCNNDNCNCRTDSICENSNAWLEDFIEQVDGAVVFKPFDFDALAEKILKEISECFHKIVGSECLLEIDSKVMEQFLAAACVSDNNKVKDWVKQVLSRGFLEAQKRYNLTASSVVKLVICEGMFLEEQEPGVCLPARIIMN
ncbi:protein SMAX1-LIKE 8 [Cornus florida]|uniref:protein SMAX1-LIKE 8 n=1 Tax=Cornus florida TaxID=4283 RepID=UPI0028968F5E|nr:protein SMAX1-LIKE 8 [Cornus florida]